MAFLFLLSSETPMFFLAGNPLICDCNLQWFKHINTRVSNFPQVMDMDRVECLTRESGNAFFNATSKQKSVLIQAKKKQLTQVEDGAFLCKYQTHCLPQCMCCDYFACDCEMTCPHGCTCFHDQTWRSNLIQCSSGNHSELPIGIPMDTTSLVLDGNNLTKLENAMLVGRSKLKHLSMQGSRISEIRNQTFVGLSDLQVLNLANNELKNLDGHEFTNLPHLRELYLQKNQLVSIEPETFKHLKYLTVLRLDGNLLISFPIWELSSNPSLNYLALANNWWQCDCDFVRKFRMYIDGNLDVIADSSSITCTSSDSGFNDCTELLGGHGFQFEKTFGSDAVPIIIASVVLVICALITLTFVLKMRETCMIWLHDKYGFRVWCCSRRYSAPPTNALLDSSEGKEILFDALVLYSSKDEKLVQDEFNKPLEANYRLCLNHRDMAGIYTSEAFKSALSASHWQIVIMSEGFLVTEWDYVRDIILPRCMVVLIDEVGNSDMKVNQEARDFIKASKRVVRWKDARFWQKVKYYLPDPTKPLTKEGGAELDVSGVWTFTSMDGANTTSKPLLSSPHQSPAPISRGVTTFPAPPVKKQPHQCEAHYLTGAPSSPATRASTTSIISGGVLNSVFASSPPPATRSCGTNAVVMPPHQRSKSAVAVAPKSAVAFKHHHHAKSSSNLLVPTHPRAQHNRESLYGVAGTAMGGNDNPPTPPPKTKVPNSIYNSSSSVFQQQQQMQREHIYGNSGTSSFLAQLMNSCPPPDTNSQSPMSSLAMIPLRASNLLETQFTMDQQKQQHNHQRSTSLLDPPSSGVIRGGSGSPHRNYIKHGRSSSNLAPGRNGSAKHHLHQRSASGLAPVSRTVSLIHQNSRSRPSSGSVANPAAPLQRAASSALQGASRLKSRIQHHKSYSNLPGGGGAAVGPDCMEMRVTHTRSSSSPHEGFVL